MRIGVLSTAQISPRALFQPAKAVAGVEIAAVASRDRQHAEDFAAEHGIARAYASYEELLADTSLDSIYNPLPPSLHAQWSIAALEAGHHVLCEKPFAANADQAKVMVSTAERSGKYLVEAFHWRYHPYAERALELARQIGPLTRALGHFNVELDSSKIGYRLDLAGGVMMGVGCYPVHWVRTLVGEEPTVDRAIGVEGPPGIDVSMEAFLRFPSGVTGQISASMIKEDSAPDAAYVHLEGQEGDLHLEMSTTSRRMSYQITAHLPDGSEVSEGEEGGTSTYVYQLRAFADVVAGIKVPITGGNDAIANMTTIDAIYRGAGFDVRQ